MTDNEYQNWQVPERRWKRVRITREGMFVSIMRLFSRRATSIVTNLPEDVQFRGMNMIYSFETDCFEIMFEHPSWENVLPGQEIPVFDLQINEIPAVQDEDVIDGIPVVYLSDGRRLIGYTPETFAALKAIGEPADEADMPAAVPSVRHVHLP